MIPAGLTATCSGSVNISHREMWEWRRSRKLVLGCECPPGAGPAPIVRLPQFRPWWVDEGAHRRALIEKDGTFADYAHALARAANGELVPRQTLVHVDDRLIQRVLNRSTGIGHAREDYWGRRFLYRTDDGRIHVLTVPPNAGPPYDAGFGQADPAAYPTLLTILRVVDRTGTRLYRDAVIPIAFAHETAAIPLGVGSDVLTLIAQEKLGIRAGRPA